MAESVIGLFKTEVVKQKGPWKTFEAIEYATLVSADWYNNQRVHSAIGYVPPVEHEQAFYDQLHQSGQVA